MKNELSQNDLIEIVLSCRDLNEIIFSFIDPWGNYGAFYITKENDVLDGVDLKC